MCLTAAPPGPLPPTPSLLSFFQMRRFAVAGASASHNTHTHEQNSKNGGGRGKWAPCRAGCRFRNSPRSYVHATSRDLCAAHTKTLSDDDETVGALRRHRLACGQMSGAVGRGGGEAPRCYAHGAQLRHTTSDVSKDEIGVWLCEKAAGGVGKVTMQCYNSNGCMGS